MTKSFTPNGFVDFDTAAKGGTQIANLQTGYGPAIGNFGYTGATGFGFGNYPNVTALGGTGLGAGYGVGYGFPGNGFIGGGQGQLGQGQNANMALYFAIAQQAGTMFGRTPPKPFKNGNITINQAPVAKWTTTTDRVFEMPLTEILLSEDLGFFLPTVFSQNSDGETKRHSAWSPTKNCTNFGHWAKKRHGRKWSKLREFLESAGTGR